MHSKWPRAYIKLQLRHWISVSREHNLALDVGLCNLTGNKIIWLGLQDVGKGIISDTIKFLREQMN